MKYEIFGSSYFSHLNYRANEIVNLKVILHIIYEFTTMDFNMEYGPLVFGTGTVLTLHTQKPCFTYTNNYLYFVRKMIFPKKNILHRFIQIFGYSEPSSGNNGRLIITICNHIQILLPQYELVTKMCH